MTMPDERMRSLRWAWEVLKSIESNSLREPSWVDRATRLAQTFPSPEHLECMLSGSTSAPATFQVTLNETRSLFEEILAAVGGSSELRNDVRSTLRHFPSEGATRALANAATVGGLSEWLEVERDTY